MDPEFLSKAQAAGFTVAQAEFFWDNLALDPHTHTADEVFMDEDEDVSVADVLVEEGEEGDESEEGDEE